MLPLRHLKQGESPSRGKEERGDVLKYLRIAKVVRVDYETGWVDIEWIKDKKVVRSFVNMPSAYSSSRGSIKGMPEEGSLVVCGWFRGQSQTLEDPIILSFLDMNINQLTGYTLLRNLNTPDDLKEIKTIREKIGYNVIRGKRRKIYPGEIHLESSPGAELCLDEDVYLSDSRLNEIEIRSADKSIRLSSNQYFAITQGSRIWNGMIQRGPDVTGSYAFQPTILSNGQKIQFVTESNQPFHLGGKAFTEHRIEMFEKGDGILKVSEVNSSNDISAMTPYITFVMGTLTGNDKTDLAKYTKILRPQVFSDRLATTPSADYVECTPYEYNSLASTLSLKFNTSLAQIDIDKQGHLFTYFPASTGAHPLGSGRSWEGAFGGSIKLVVGAENIENKSLFVDTKGGARLNLGFDNAGKSLVVMAKKGVYLEVLDKADDGTAYFIKTKGDYKGLIDGNYNLEVTGNYNIRVHGKIQEEIMGTKIQNYINDFNNLYGGSYKKIVTKDLQEQIGYNRDSKITGNLETAPGIFAPATIDQWVDVLAITTGGKKTTLLLGNILEEITKGDIKRHVILKNTVGIKDTVDTGNHETDITIKGDIKRHVLLKDTVGIKDTVETGDIQQVVTTGDIKETVTTGNITDTITTGSLSETVTTGDIKETVTKGDIKETITTGNHETKVKTGDIKENITVGSSTEAIVTGSKKVTITTGDFVVSITAGKVDITTKTGAIKLDSVSQTVDINGMLSVTVKSGVKLNLKGPMVEIGQIPTMGGVVTGLPGVPSTTCYITGSPFLGSKTVKCAI